jgi:hypothetical protein
MANYKVVFRADLEDNRGSMTWEPGCPVLVEAVQVSRNTDTSEAYLQIKVQNVYGRTVDEITAEATVVYKTEPEQTIRIQELDCALRPGASQALKPVKLAHGDASDASVAILSVAGQSIEWETGGEAEPVPEPAELPISETAMAERVRLLKEKDIPAKAAKKLPVATGDWWVCGCGQITVGNRKCLACGSNLADLLGLQDEEQLLDSIYERAAAQQAEGTADSLKAAREAFASLGEYRDSSQRAAECIEKRQEVLYENAVTDFETNTQDSLEKAVFVFHTLGDYRDSADKVAACRTRLNEIQAANKATRSKKHKRIAILAIIATIIVLAAAFAWYNLVTLPGMYADAMELYEQGEYESAYIEFEKLGSYRDSKQLMEECDYSDAYTEFKVTEVNGNTITISCSDPSRLMEARAKIQITYTHISGAGKTVQSTSVRYVTSDEVGKDTITVTINNNLKLLSAEVTGYTPA